MVHLSRFFWYVNVRKSLIPTQETGSRSEVSPDPSSAPARSAPRHLSGKPRASLEAAKKEACVFMLVPI